MPSEPFQHLQTADKNQVITKSATYLVLGIHATVFTVFRQLQLLALITPSYFSLVVSTAQELFCKHTSPTHAKMLSNHSTVNHTKRPVYRMEVLYRGQKN